jgi:hypothetical protein
VSPNGALASADRRESAYSPVSGAKQTNAAKTGFDGSRDAVSQ